MANKFEALAGLFASLSSYTAATTATADEITDEINERVDRQEKINKRYDTVKAALKKADNTLTDEDLDEQLLEMGLEKVSLTKFKRGLKQRVTDELNTEKRKNTFGAISEIKQLTNELGDLLEEEPAPETELDKLIKVMTIQAQANLPQAPAPQQTAPTTGPTWSANLLEKSRLTREKDQKIAEIRNIKKSGGITALEMAQAISDINSDYKKKIGNL